MFHAGLVLEGGGMKGIYTAGVLDLFLEKGIMFSSVYGVSAGACHMLSYLSKQPGRARDVSVDYLDSRHYCSLESLILTGNVFNTEMCYHLIPDYLCPFDNETYRNYPGRAYSVVTNIVTGQPEYLRIRSYPEDIDKVRASASLPLVAQTVSIDGQLYLDGGLSDSIPLQRSVVDGNRKSVVVMTKEIDYVRQPVDSKMLALVKARYKKYPRVAELMEHRHTVYNECLAYIDDLERRGQAFVIRPRHKNNVGRIEKDKQKMLALYQEGYDEAAERYEDLMRFLEN